MAYPRVYADFQNLDNFNRPRLTCAGTLEDLSQQKVHLHQGLVLALYMDDADDEGQPDELRTEGTVEWNGEENCWVATIDWSALRHASEEAASPSPAPRATIPAVDPVSSTPHNRG
jgi:hypothetical protein